MTINNVDISIKSSNILAKVPGVGFDNSLRVTMNSTFRGVKVKYRIYISEVGTTQSKVKDLYFSSFTSTIMIFKGLL